MSFGRHQKFPHNTLDRGSVVAMTHRIGTWNLENLFRPGEDGPSSKEEYDAKLTSLAAVINDLRPDVLCVQEIGDPEALADLVKLLAGEWHTALADPDGRGIRAGIISALSMSEVDQIAAFPDALHPLQVDDDGTTITAMGRPALKANITLGSTTVTVISAHLKSKLLSFPGGRFTPKDEGQRARFAFYALSRRAGESTALRASVDLALGGAGAHQSVLVAGDLNDEPEAATTQILLGPGGSEIGTPGFEKPDKGDATRLWNLAPKIPEAERYSRVYQGRNELIDHILVSKALVDKVVTVSAGSAKMGSTPSIDDDPNRRKDKPGSDHRPVVADFEL